MRKYKSSQSHKNKERQADSSLVYSKPGCYKVEQRFPTRRFRTPGCPKQDFRRSETRFSEVRNKIFGGQKAIFEGESSYVHDSTFFQNIRNL